MVAQPVQDAGGALLQQHVEYIAAGFQSMVFKVTAMAQESDATSTARALPFEMQRRTDLARGVLQYMGYPDWNSAATLLGNEGMRLVGQASQKLTAMAAQRSPRQIKRDMEDAELYLKQASLILVGEDTRGACQATTDDIVFKLQNSALTRALSPLQNSG